MQAKSHLCIHMYDTCMNTYTYKYLQTCQMRECYCNFWHAFSFGANLRSPGVLPGADR